MSKSLFGSVKDKFRSKSSNSSKTPTMKSTDSNPFHQSTAPASVPQVNVNGEAPPAYSPVPLAPPPPSSTLHPGSSNRRPSPAPSMASVTNDDDKYAFLTTFDTIFLIDDSGSMAGSNWREVDTALRSLTPICTSHDADGIDLYFLNHKSTEGATPERPAGGFHGIKRADTVENIFRNVQPKRATPLGTRLHSILKPYITSLSNAASPEDVKPVNIIVITDGRPTDDPESVIVQHAKKLDAIEAPPYQVGIQFFQVGSDAGAREFLRELDDDLGTQGVRDMVDATTWDASNGRPQPLTADGILKVVLGAVVRRLDRKATVNTGRSHT